MKLNTNKKTMTFVITSILLLTITAQMLLLPPTNAHTPKWTIPSFSYVSVAPSPVGVGQTVQIYMWVDTPLPGAVITNDIRRHGYTLTITKPDGNTVTQNWDLIDDTTGVQFFSYTPDQIGTYAILFNYTGQTYTWSGDYQNDCFRTSKCNNNLNSATRSITNTY